jgi:hypothetical protein
MISFRISDDLPYAEKVSDFAEAVRLGSLMNEMATRINEFEANISELSFQQQNHGRILLFLCFEYNSTI